MFDQELLFSKNVKSAHLHSLMQIYRWCHSWKKLKSKNKTALAYLFYGTINNIININHFTLQFQ